MRRSRPTRRGPANLARDIRRARAGPLRSSYTASAQFQSASGGSRSSAVLEAEANELQDTFSGDGIDWHYLREWCESKSVDPADHLALLRSLGLNEQSMVMLGLTQFSDEASLDGSYGFSVQVAGAGNATFGSDVSDGDSTHGDGLHPPADSNASRSGRIDSGSCAGSVLSAAFNSFSDGDVHGEDRITEDALVASYLNSLSDDDISNVSDFRCWAMGRQIALQDHVDLMRECGVASRIIAEVIAEDLDSHV